MGRRSWSVAARWWIVVATAALALGATATPVGAEATRSATYTVPNPPAVDTQQFLAEADAGSQSGGLHAVAPQRLLDTRTTGRISAGGVADVAVTGQAGLPPSGVDAAVLTLTITEPIAAGYATAYPCGTGRPDASNVNFTAGATVPNLTTVSVGSTGHVCIYTSAPTNLVVDVSAWYGVGDDRAASVAPTRIADTRTTKTKLAAGGVLVVRPTVAPDVPATGVTAVAVNVTATEPERAGFLTVYPCDQPAPLTSNVNYTAWHDTADAAVVGVSGMDGTICVFSSAPTHVVVDINGWFGALGLARFQAQVPKRLLDTRSSGSGLGAGGVVAVTLPTAAGVAAVNVTVTGARGRGFITAFACGSGRPLASNVNFAAGDVVANAAVVPVGSGDAVCFFSSAPTHLVVDLNGTFAATLNPQTGPVPGTALPAIQWGLTQVGRPYAAVNPFRFGDSVYGEPWACDDGSNPCTRVDMHGTTRTYPVGTFVYDCSGFVVAAWLRSGVDLVKANAAWTDAMLDHVAKVDAAAARQGDIVLFDYSGAGDETNSRTDHAGLYLTTATMLQAGDGGVSVAKIDWTKVVAVVRPAA